MRHNPTTNKPSARLRATRRDVLKVAALAAGGLALGFHLSVRGRAFAQSSVAKVYPPNAFLRIGLDDSVTVITNRLEFGQGVHTALPMLLAEELDCDFARVRSELAPAAAIYADPVLGFMLVGGSSSIPNSVQQYREIGARARAMLMTAAGKRWKVSAATLRTKQGVVIAPDGRQLRYGEVAADAMRLPLPRAVKLKDPQHFSIIGTRQQRLDSYDKVTGRQKFGIDTDLPGLLIAVVARAPVWGMKVRTVDDTAALAVRGVKRVFRIPGDRGGESVAVIAADFWSARKGREALQINWDDTGVERVDSEALFASYRALAATPGKVAVQSVMPVADEYQNKFDVEYRFPYLAHAPMEPLNFTIRFDGERCEIWNGSQTPDTDQGVVAKVLGISQAAVQFNTPMTGGGFGRRTTTTAHLAVEAALIARELRGVAVKLMWTREDDITGGYYRPLHVHRVRAALGADGRIALWDHVIVGQSIFASTPFESFFVKDDIDETTIEGAKGTPYQLPGFRLSVHHPVHNVPVLWWRSVGHSHTAFVMETLLDELATAAKRDVIAFRRELLGNDKPRHQAVLARVVLDSGYGTKALPAGHAFGVAMHESFRSIIAYVVEISIERDLPKVHQVWAAVDCGMAVNPLTIEAQIQGGVQFGLSMLLPGFEMPLVDGRPQKSNFHQFTPVYGTEAPDVSVSIIKSNAPPGGMGEPPVPPIAPAVVNAIASLTGKRIRKLPIERGDLA
jgi:isoquinoline 1-oxidoreductase subunit beta